MLLLLVHLTVLPIVSVYKTQSRLKVDVLATEAATIAAVVAVVVEVVAVVVAVVVVVVGAAAAVAVVWSELI